MIDHMAKLRLREETEATARAAAEAFFGKSREYKNSFRGEGRNRPICPFCNKRHGKRDIKYKSDRYAIGTPIPENRSNHHLMLETIRVGSGMGPDNGPGATCTRETWDGVTYVSTSGTDPFCTQLCALLFAKAAYAANYRIVRKQETAT